MFDKDSDVFRVDFGPFDFDFDFVEENSRNKINDRQMRKNGK